MIGDFLKHFLEIIKGIIREGWIYLVLLLMGAGVGTYLVVSGGKFSTILQLAFDFVKAFWLNTYWLWIFIFLFFVVRDLWLHWRQEIFKNSIKWKLLEIRIPQEVRKSPEAMEQVLLVIHTLRNAPGDIREKYWEGEVTRWYSLEMVSFGGEIHFYLRLYHKQKDLAEAAFFSYYRDVEIAEVDDYVDKLPANLREVYAQDSDVWGTEMLLARENAYPIKTYHQFESIEEERQYDPISVFLEILGKVKKGEFVGIQILIAPLGEKWKDKCQAVVEKLKQKTKAERAEEEMAEKTRTSFVSRTPGETDILKAVENNLSKRAFDTLIRFMYISPKSIFHGDFPRRGIAGAFNQYSLLSLNSFQQNHKIGTRTRIWKWPHIFPKRRCEFRKQRLLFNYRKREVPPETFMGKLITSSPFHLNFASRRFAMNTEGLATLFHPPTSVVLTAPHIKRVESRKVGPPAGLAIFGEEEEIEKFI